MTAVGFQENSAIAHKLPAQSASSGAVCGTGEAAALLRLSVATIQAMVERGQLEAWKTSGGHRRITLNSVHQHLARLHPNGLSGRVSLTGRLRVLMVEKDEALRAERQAAMSARVRHHFAFFACFSCSPRERDAWSRRSTHL